MDHLRRNPLVENRMSQSSDLPETPDKSPRIKPSASAVTMDSTQHPVVSIGACVKEGQDWYTGVEKAPAAFLDAGLETVVRGLGREFHFQGNIDVDQSIRPKIVHSEGYYLPGQIKDGPKLGDALGKIHKAVKGESDKRNFVLTLGGDHSVAAATISGIKQSCDSRGEKLAVVWVDAHADCNIPETSGSGNFHGMPVGILMGWFKKKVENFEWIESYLRNPLEEHRLAFIGLRDVDEGEKQLLRNSNIMVYSMIDVERMGIATIMDEIFKAFSDCQLHLSLDVDGIDPMFAPGTGTRAKGGLNYREARYICSSLASSGKLMSMDLVEVNPSLDVPSEQKHEHGDNSLVSTSASQTVKLGIDLIEFSLGKRLV
jgi:arginase